MTLLNLLKNKIYQFIDKLQKYFKIDFFYLIKGEFWLMLGRIISMTLAFLLSLAWANWISKEIYGNYQYVLSLIGIISVFSLPGIGTAVTQAVARKFEGSFIHGFKTQLKWGILGSLSAIGIASYYWLQGNKNLSLSFFIVAIFLPLFNASIIYFSFLMGKKLFNIQVKYDSITQIIAVSVMILTLFSINKFLFNSSNYIILLLVISIYFLPRTILRLFFFIKTKIKFQPNKREDPKTIIFGKHLSLSNIVDVMSNNLDKILLFHYLGAIELAVYSFAILIPHQIKYLLKHIGNLAMPKFSVRSRKEIRKTILRKILSLCLLITCLVFIYIIIAPFIYQIFFPKYLDSVSYSQLYALSIIPLSFSIGSVLRAKMMTKEIYQIQIIISLTRTILFIILIPLYGIWGAVIGILSTRICSAALSLLLIKKI
jgi:O-antigen/teichoic acid export membrane protein